MTHTLGNRDYQPHSPLVDRLDDLSVSAALELQELLDLPTLDFETLDDVKKALNLSDAERPAGFSELDFDPDDDYQLCAAEEATLDKLHQALVSMGTPLACWFASYDMGARFLASCLPLRPGFKDKYDAVYSIVPSDLSAPFGAELMAVGDALGIDSVMDLAGEIVKRLISERRLLIISGIEVLEDRDAAANGHLLRSLLNAALDRRHVRGRVPVLVIGELPTSLKRLGLGAYSVSYDDPLDDALKVAGKDRFVFFRQQWLRFVNSRGLNPAGEIGSRLKRAQWHYDEIRPRTVYPINLRVRAYFASNFDNHAFFDPTAGFAILAGDRPLPRDIQFFAEDVYRQIPLGGKRGSELRLLRMMSTAKYWLTPKTLRMLAQPDEGTRKLTDNQIETLISKSAVISRPKPSPKDQNWDAPSAQYAVSIGVKAVIQDQWLHTDGVETPTAKTDRAERAFAHWRVANHLYESRNNRAILLEEFPVSPLWSKIHTHLTSEALRHLVRAIEFTDERDTKKSTRPAFEKNGFPRRPHGQPISCDPATVINFCYEELFLRQLNGDEGPHVLHRRLTTEHGAFALAMELIQLMSAPGKFGTPHWALDKAHYRSFFTEAGYAALNVGRFDQALKAFNDLVALELELSNPIHIADALLHKARVLIAFDQLDAAEASLDNAKDRLKGVTPVDTESVDALARSLGRLERRRAQLLFLKGERKEAYKALTAIFGQSRQARRLKPELMSAFVDLLREDKSKSKPDPLGVCVRAMSRASSEGLQHEAIGYKIAFARLLRGRDLNPAAEAVLDDVHIDISRFGCSEPTYLAFLLEAGETLLAMERGDVRAYATYAYGCLVRAKAREFPREWAAAKNLCERALIAVKERASNFNPEDWLAELQAQVKQDTEYRDLDKPELAGPFARDPLYGYAIGQADAEHRIGELQPENIDGILLRINAMTPPVPSGCATAT